ncbi:MAG TPA: hypothetical protein PK309_07830, partial [Bacillota bacterium]|nr:hypothetical protein [Bacillota bacterium]
SRPRIAHDWLAGAVAVVRAQAIEVAGPAGGALHGATLVGLTLGAQVVSVDARLLLVAYFALNPVHAIVESHRVSLSPSRSQITRLTTAIQNSALSVAVIM